MPWDRPHTFEAGSDIDAVEHEGNWGAFDTWAADIESGGEVTPVNDTTWRTIHELPAIVAVGVTTAAIWAPSVATGGITSLTASQSGIPVFYLDDADSTLSGETPVLRLRAQAYVNSTAPAMTFTVGLHNVTGTTSPSAAAIHLTLNATAVSGSTIAFASPSAESLNQNVTSAFSFPADGYYGVAFTSSGAMAANSVVAIAAQLQVRVAD